MDCTQCRSPDDTESTGDMWVCWSCQHKWEPEGEAESDGSERSASGAQASPFADEFANLPSLELVSWPSFVAIPVDQWLGESHPVQRLNRIADACEVLVRYVCAIAIADASDRDGSQFPGLGKRSRPSIGRSTTAANIGSNGDFMVTQTDRLATRAFPSY